MVQICGEGSWGAGLEPQYPESTFLQPPFSHSNSKYLPASYSLAKPATDPQIHKVPCMAVDPAVAGCIASWSPYSPGD